MALAALLALVLAVGCSTAESDAIIREYANRYADCVNMAVDEAIANAQNRVVVEDRIVRDCYPIADALVYEKHVTMEDNAHNYQVWIEIVRPAEKRVNTVPWPDPKCQLAHVKQCPPKQDEGAR